MNCFSAAARPNFFRCCPQDDRVHLASGEPLTPIAGDASGGVYLLTASGAVVYAGSEGEGGLIALNLRDPLALRVGLPSLHDALARPLGDGLLEWLSAADEAYWLIGPYGPYESMLP